MITWIKDTKASIFNSSCSVLVNPVNCEGIMGAGLALEFKRKFPVMFISYKASCARGDLRVGKLYCWRSFNDKNFILCFPTKDFYARPSNLLYIRAGLTEFVRIYRFLGIDSVAFPMLGCGLGGLDRGEVREIMDEYLGALKDLRVEIYLR